MQSFSETILSWYDTYGRDLPWRRTRDPYAIWLSEIILQQTRIAQGQAYWERFLATWPDVQTLAAASEDEVLRLWQGLGYYSRARNLHAAARQIVAAGRFPDTLEGIRALKGVGYRRCSCFRRTDCNQADPVPGQAGNPYLRDISKGNRPGRRPCPL